jgi:serine/threonine protein kinase/tetratricopeptide (TPR) repeat protein
MIGKVISHYRILERIGEGGMGVVFKAEDTRLKRTIALKFLPPELTRNSEAKERFIHEAQAASALQHNNICVVYDIDESDDGQMFISMEYIEGETLRDRLERGPLPIDQAIELTLQIGKALAKAHELGIVHRDIKPANIMLTRDGTAKIVDFGLAKLTGRSVLTQAGSTVGTLAYMSPEQIRGMPADRRTDIWALGAVLYELLSGKQPFRGEYNAAILFAILEGEPEPLGSLAQGIPPEIPDVVARALAKDAADRYQQMEEMVGDLQAFRGGNSASVPALPRVPKRRRTLWPIYAGSAAVLFGVAITALVMTHQGERGPSVRSLAVLPFRNTTASLEDTVFAEGMTEALSTELSKIGALVVRSSRSAMRFRNSDKELPEIARELNVDALVDGSTQLSGRSVRVSVNLINVNPERQIWGENYREELEDINSLQGKVAQAIAREIRVVLTPEEQTRLARTVPVNPEAFQACVYGRFYWNKWTTPGFRKSLEYFRLAAQRDPAYAPAYAGIADVYATLWYNGMVPFDSVEPFWRPAAEKALELDPRMAEGHVSRAATRLVYDWDWRGSEEELKVALRLNPGYATGHHWYSLLLSALGRHDSAIAEAQRALEIDPLSVIILASAGWVHFHAGRYDQAVAKFQKALELDSLCAPAHSGLGEIFEIQGKDEEALAEYLRLAGLTGGSFATLRGGIGDPVSRLRIAYRASGWHGYWTEELRQLEEISRTTYVSSFHIASVCARLKKQDEAFRWLQRAFQERSTNLLFGKVDPNMENLKDDPRYGALMKGIGLAEQFP